MAELREAIRLDPSVAAAHLSLGGALGMLDKFDEAVAECREAIRLDTTNAVAHVLLGGVLVMQGELAEAAAEEREALRLDPVGTLVLFLRNWRLDLFAILVAAFLQILVIRFWRQVAARRATPRP